MTTFKNFTPHDVKLNNGKVYPSMGVARVSATFSAPVDGVCHQLFGPVVGLPDPQPGVKYIVSAYVLGATTRTDVVAPATGHPAAVRDDKGHIVSVPCFVR
ncbi:MAG: hypothetical protein ACKOWO_03220 [Sediminibacterium sp.]